MSSTRSVCCLPLSRRAFLRGAGVALALPALEAMQPAYGAQATVPARRLVAIQTNMGIMPHLFFPEKGSADALDSPYLNLLDPHKRDLTAFGGVSHPGVDGGHTNEKSFLTGAPHPAGSGFRNTISLDQFAAERIGAETRFASLVLSSSNARAGTSMSYSATGVEIPGEGSPAALYRRLFVRGSASESSARVHDLRSGRSLLDFVSERARRLSAKIGNTDRARIDQYLTAVRELEGQLVKAEAWEATPLPQVEAPAPEDVGDKARLLDRVRLLLDVTRLALQTDSTRVVSVMIEPLGILSAIPGVEHETHSLTHHGNRSEMIEELRKIEESQFRVLDGFLTELKSTPDGAGTLLDHTMVLYGTCMGNANGHANTNWPMLLAGGGFRHGRYLEFDRDRNYPLANLYVSLLQRLGIGADRFASGTATMRGLEIAS